MKRRLPISIASMLVLSFPGMLVAQNLFLSGGSGGDIYRFAPDGTRTTVTSGLFYSGLACDYTGNLFAASPAPDGNGIYKFTPGGVRTTFASGLSQPWGLAFDRAGNLLEADYASGTIFEFTPSGMRSIFVSGLRNPYGLAFDGTGNLFATADHGSTLYKFTAGGAGSSFGSGLVNPIGIACNAAGHVFVADLGGGSTQDGSIYEFAPDGVRTTFASGLDCIGLAFDGAGNLFAADYGSDKIYRFTPDGTRSTFASGVNGHGVFFLAFQVPEPSVWGLLGWGGLVLFGWRCRAGRWA